MRTRASHFAIVVTITLGVPLRCACQSAAAPLRIQGVSETALECIRATLPQHDMSLPQGSTGVLTGPGGAQASFAWDQKSRTLTFSIISLPPFISNAEALADIGDFSNACAGTDSVEQLARTAASETWRINSPDVRKSDTAYSQIHFKGGDSLQVAAGGCAQTGGHGATWRLYVNPKNDNLHHGLIQIPGQQSFVRLKDIAPNQVLSVPANFVGEATLHLGYEDTDYSDNGYWGRDAGPGGECQGLPNAWVRITVNRVPTPANPH